jgi:hypothetical protein
MDGPADQEIQRLNRSALVEVLVALAAGPEAQVALAHGQNNLPVDELIDDYVEWIYTAVPLISDAGLFPAGAIELLDQLDDLPEPAAAQRGLLRMAL